MGLDRGNLGKEWICEEVPAVTMDGKPITTMLHKTDELVRCKDCKHHSDTEILEYKVCTKWKNWIRNFATADNWFCADGERRDDDDG